MSSFRVIDKMPRTFDTGCLPFRSIGQKSKNNLSQRLTLSDLALPLRAESPRLC
jgi:hypothetical protein